MAAAGEVEIEIDYGEEPKAADKGSNSKHIKEAKGSKPKHNKDASTGKKEGDQKINGTTEGQNSTYTNNQCTHSVNGSVYGGTVEIGGSKGNQTRYENNRVIYNNGNFNGNANGCFNEGGFQSHTTHYYDESRG